MGFMRVFLLMFFISSGSNGASNIDSLLLLLDKGGDHDIPRLHYALADAYYESDHLLLSAEQYLLAAEHELRKTSPDYRLVCESYGNAGYVFNELDRYTESIRYSQKCYNFAVEAVIPDEQSASLVNMGSSWFNLGDFEKAAQCFMDAIAIDESRSDTVGIGINYNNLGKIYESWGNYEQALEYYLKSLKISELMNDSARIAIRLSSVGMAYHGLKDTEKSLRYLEKSLQLDRLIRSGASVGTRLSNIGQVLLSEGRVSEAEENFLQAIGIFRQYNSLRSLAITLNQLGNLYLNTPDRQNSIALFGESLDISKQTGNIQLLMKNYGDIARFHESAGNLTEAYPALKQYHMYKDSLFNQKSLRTIEELKIKNDLITSENEILLLRQEKELQDKMLKQSKIEKISFLIFALIASILLLSISRLYHQKLMLSRELQLTNSSKDKFFTIISHDLKNPVRAFGNISNGLLNALPDLKNEEIEPYLVELQKSSHTLYELLQNLLHWAKSQSHMHKPDFRKENLTEIIDKVVESQHAAIHQKGIVLETDLDGKPDVYVDRNLILTVLRNILSNAVRYSDPGGRIVIGFSQVNNHESVFRITDYGPGMSDEDMEKLFRIDVDPKKIGSSEVLRRGKGSGLGLILSKELVQSMNGRIWVDSAPMKGSTFYVSVPGNRGTKARNHHH